MEMMKSFSESIRLEVMAATSSIIFTHFVQIKWLSIYYDFSRFVENIKMKWNFPSVKIENYFQSKGESLFYDLATIKSNKNIEMENFLSS